MESPLPRRFTVSLVIVAQMRGKLQVLEKSTPV
jgi:hypothetical protein